MKDLTNVTNKVEKSEREIITEVSEKAFALLKESNLTVAQAERVLNDVKLLLRDVKIS